MSKVLSFIGGSVVVTGLTAAGLWWYNRVQAGVSPAPTPGPTPGPTTPSPEAPLGPPPGPIKLDPISWVNVAPMPVPADVKGDLSKNWGSTPTDLRPLLLLIEEASGIVGAARYLAIVAFRESAFTATAHNGDAENEQGERNASWRGYQNNKAHNPPLMFGEMAANFGSGGLFGGLAPYALWTAVQELKDKAPLLGSDPRILFIPRVAGFVAAVYLCRLLKYYNITDHADLKVGWGSISLLSESGRKSPDYARIRQRFFEDAKAVGIDLADTTTIPTKMSADAWPGAKAVFDKIVVTLPTPGKVVVA
jgi:hypothetical protein